MRFSAELTHFFIWIYQFYNITFKFIWNLSILMPELADILVGDGQFHGIKFKCCQVSVDLMTRIGIFFNLKCSVFQINVQIWIPIDRYFAWNWRIIYLNLSIFQYNVQICLKFVDFFAGIADILVGNGQFYSFKFKCCQVSVDFLTGIGIFFYMKWSVLQINDQIWIPIDRYFARNFYIFYSLLNFSV